MARTKQTARKSVDRRAPIIIDSNESSSSEHSDASSSSEHAQGIKRARENIARDDEPAPEPPRKKIALGQDPLLRNKIHFRMHSIADLVTERFPSMRANTELMDRAIERAKHALLDELEEMLIDCEDKE